MPKNIDYDKLQDSLEYIKTVCEDQKDNGGCVGCPLGNKSGFCMLGICPAKWTPRHPAVDVFRVIE